MRSMDSILHDEPSVHTLPDGPESDSLPEEHVAEVKADKGETPAKVEAKASTKPEPETGDGGDPEDADSDPIDQSVEGLKKAISAVRGDKRKMRKKWQETQRRVDQLEGQLAAFQQMGARREPEPKAEPAAKGPDFYASPEEYISAKEKALQAHVEHRDFQTRANISEALLSEQHEDYEAAKAAFVKAAQSAPWLWQQVTADVLPARVVYREGKKLLGGGVSEVEAKLQAEIAELKAKMAGGEAEQAAKAPSRPIPKSNASARGTGAGAKKAWSGPRSLNEIIGH